MRADWVECKLGEIFEIVSGNTPKGLESISNEGNIQFYKVSDMNSLGNEVNMSSSNYNLSESDIDKLKIKLFPKGTIIFPKRGGAILTNKKRKLKYNSSFDLNIMGVIPNKFVDSNYLFNFFISIDLGKIADGSNVPQINNKNIEPLLFPLPPLPEQRAIVKKIEALFSSLDAGIADLKKAQEQLKIYRQAVLKKAFEGELVKCKMSFNSLEALSEIITKGASPKWQGFDYIDKNELLFITSENVREGYIDFKKTKYLPKEFNNIQSRSELKFGDLLFNIVGASIGRCAAYKYDFFANINQAVALIRLKEKLLSDYIVLYLNSEVAIREYLLKQVDVARANLSLKDVGSIAIPMPSDIHLIAQIVKEIESRLSVCDAVEQQIKDSLSQAEALRQSILKKAFEGKLLTEEEIKACQQEPDYEPAAVLLEKIKAEKEAKKSTKKSKKVSI